MSARNDGPFMQRRYWLTEKGEQAAMTTTATIHLADLHTRHHGHHIRAAGLEGILVGSFTVRDRVQLALLVGGARVWSDLLDGDVEVEVWVEGGGRR